MNLKQVLAAVKTQVLHSYILVLVVVSAFALMAALSSYFMTDIVRNQLAFNAKMELDSLENSIKADLKEPRTALGNEAESIRIMIMHGAGEEEVRTYLKEITRYKLSDEEQLANFGAFYGYFNVFGGALFSGQEHPVSEDYAATERAWYKEAAAAGGEIVFIYPHLWEMSKTPEVVLTYARGIFDNEGNLLGVVALNMDFERISKYIVNENKGKMWWGILLDGDYKFLFHIDSKLVGTRFEDMNSDTARAAAELKSGHEISEFRMRNYQNIPSITFMRKMDNGWHLGIVTPEDVYFSEVKRVQLILIALGAALSVLFSVIMIRIVTGKEKADAERQRANAMLKEADGLIENINIMQKILNNLDAIIYITNPQTGEIMFINENAKKYYHADDDCIGELCYTVFQEGLGERCDFCPCNKLDTDPGKVIEWIEYSAATKRHYRNTACYITWPGGSIAHLRYSVDITELYAAREQAVLASRVKSDFLARMSHEIRSPLNVILGIIEIELEKEGLPQDTIEALDRVHNSGYLLLNIINDILDLSKIESGKMELLPVNYDISSVINDTVQLNLMRFANKPIQFSLKVDENTPAKLFGDDLRIKQVLNNLLSNAFKYTESGSITLSVSAEAPVPGNPVTLIFRLSDTGRGMSKEQVDKLFEDYARFDSEANRQIEGTGLGMPITKNFIDMMKGEIHVDSELGKGSVFTLRLPQGYVNSNVLGREGAESLQKFDVEKKARQKRAPQINREYMPYGKILIVDDMEPNLYVARGLLSPYGLSMETALSGDNAIEKVKSGQIYDVIFMDHYMPEMDGMEATKIIRDLGYTKPIIALTANALVGQAEMYLANGFDGFLSKPIDTRHINSILNRFIRDKYPPETVEAARQLKKRLEKEKEKGEAGDGPEDPDLSKMRALVVDDFQPNLNVAAGMLGKFRIQADCVLSGKEAVERIRREDPKYDFVFMDLLMPEMDGTEATRAIRSLGTKYAAAVPIIALTAIPTGETAEVDSAFQLVLSKPLTLPKVDAFIKEWLSDKLKSTASAPEKEKKEIDMKIDIPGVDEEKVMEMYGGDLDIYLPVLRSYLSVIPEALEKMGHVTQETLPEYTVKVHGVKGTSDSIGAGEARKMALELEMAAKAGDISLVLAKNGALIQYVKELLDNIQKWLAKIDG